VSRVVRDRKVYKADKEIEGRIGRGHLLEGVEVTLHVLQCHFSISDRGFTVSTRGSCPQTDSGS
jgi:hypothetical protein